jgi:hypothetical protein
MDFLSVTEVAKLAGFSSTNLSGQPIQLRAMSISP